MRLILAFLLGILVTHLWNNPTAVDTWRTEAENRIDRFLSGVHAATE